MNYELLLVVLKADTETETDQDTLLQVSTVQMFIEKMRRNCLLFFFEGFQLQHRLCNYLWSSDVMLVICVCAEKRKQFVISSTYLELDFGAKLSIPSAAFEG